MPEADDVVDALAGRPFARLRKWERSEAHKAAVAVLVKRHAAELREIEDNEATRRLAARRLF